MIGPLVWDYELYYMKSDISSYFFHYAGLTAVIDLLMLFLHMSFESTLSFRLLPTTSRHGAFFWFTMNFVFVTIAIGLA